MFKGVSLVAGALLVYVVAGSPARSETQGPADCRDDAMIVFDASGSMAGTDMNSPPTPKIAKVKDALARVLPSIAELRRLGLMDYGPGPYNQCDNIELQLKPTPNASARIMAIVDSLIPAGRTPLTTAVRKAARVLDFPEKTAVVVLLTDGEETCGGIRAGSRAICGRRDFI
jgi:Ca-activated chloride channel family protein